MNTDDKSEIQSHHMPPREAPPTSTSDVAIADVILTRPFSTGLIEFGVAWMRFRIDPQGLPKKTEVSGKSMSSCFFFLKS